MKHLTAVSLILILAVFNFACKQSGEQKTEESSEVTVDGVAAEGTVIEELTALQPEYVPVREVAMFLMRTGVPYNTAVTNSPDNVEDYKDKPVAAAANIGIYTTDALYHYSYGDMDAANASYRSAYQLAKSLDVGGTYTTIHTRQFSNDPAIRDSIFIEIDKALLLSAKRFNETEREVLNYAILVGGFTQRMYITTFIYNDLNESTDIEIIRATINSILRKKEVVKKLIALGNKVLPTNDGPFLQILGELNSIYSEIALDENSVSTLEAKELLSNQRISELSVVAKELHDFIIATE